MLNLTNLKQEIHFDLEFLRGRKMLVIDDAPEMSEFINKKLISIGDINDVNILTRTVYFSARNSIIKEKIYFHREIIISTTFTSIKSEYFEDLIKWAVIANLKNKCIFSLLEFNIVGSDFKEFEREIIELYKNNCLFYFWDKSCFKLYQPKV